MWHKTVKVEGLDIFYREAGLKGRPTIVLLHGFPSSSYQFRNLIPQLAGQFHVIAPDYPGFGNSSMPLVNEFDYSFDHVSEVVQRVIDSLSIEKFSLYLFDYGAPIGLRIASRYPERIDSLIIQNGNAYEEGLNSSFWDPLKAFWKDKSQANKDALGKFLSIDATKWQYTFGTRNPDRISPDNWNMDQFFLDRPGNDEIQLQLFYDYGSNLSLYPKWQEYFRDYQPPTLITWGKNDPVFPGDVASIYQRDLKNIELHLLDTGHFALVEDGDEVAGLIRRFLITRLPIEAAAI